MDGVLSPRRFTRVVIALFAFACPSLAVESARQSERPQSMDLRERVDVERVVIEVRAVHNDGTPLPNLTIDDFTARIDGRKAEIESIDWIAPETLKNPIWTEVTEEQRKLGLLPGRLIVLLIQRNIDPSRIYGLMRFVPQLEELFASLTPNDRIAVLSYDDRSLRLYSDFTNDYDALLEMIPKRIVYMRRPDAEPVDSFPSLAANLDMDEAADCPTIERGLELVADALEDLPGAKSLIVVGWGLGERVGGSVQMAYGYEDARLALARARTAMFSLDVTRADYHDLEGPMRLAAMETGGFYAKTHPTHWRAMLWLTRVIKGHYEVTLRKPARRTRRTKHLVSIRLPNHPKATPLYRRYYNDSPRDGGLSGGQ